MITHIYWPYVKGHQRIYTKAPVHIDIKISTWMDILAGTGMTYNNLLCDGVFLPENQTRFMEDRKPL